MNIIIADDEPLALEMTCEAVREVCPSKSFKTNRFPFALAYAHYIIFEEIVYKYFMKNVYKSALRFYNFT